MTKPASTLLIISLALNLVLIGLVAGVFIKRANTLSEHRSPPPSTRATSEERRFTRQFLEDAFTQTQAKRTARSQARKAVHDALLAPKIDIAEIEALLASFDEHESDLRIGLNQNLLDKLPDMSQSQRAAIARRLFMRRDRTARRGGRDRRPY